MTKQTTITFDKLVKELKDEIILDGKSDYNQVAHLLREKQVKPTNQLVWKIINAIKDDGNFIEVVFD